MGNNQKRHNMILQKKICILISLMAMIAVYEVESGIVLGRMYDRLNWYKTLKKANHRQGRDTLSKPSKLNSKKIETKDSNNFDVGDFLDDLDNFSSFLSNQK